MHKLQRSWVRSKNPSAQWNLRGGRWSSAEYCTNKKKKIPQKNIEKKKNNLTGWILCPLTLQCFQVVCAKSCAACLKKIIHNLRFLHWNQWRMTCTIPAGFSKLFLHPIRGWHKGISTYVQRRKYAVLWIRNYSSYTGSSYHLWKVIYLI